MAKNIPIKNNNDITQKLNQGFKKVKEKLIAETKAKNSYLVVADKKGNIKKIPASEL